MTLPRWRPLVADYIPRAVRLPDGTICLIEAPEPVTDLRVEGDTVEFTANGVGYRLPIGQLP